MDRYGFPGDVSYMHQNRYQPDYRGLGSTVRAGAYRGALGKRVRLPDAPSRAHDAAMFRGMGITLAGSGLGAVSDREMCRILSTTAGALIGTIGGAALGPRPERRAGETTTAFNQRVAQWETASRTTTGAGTSVTAAAELCNLIDEASTSTGTDEAAAAGGMSDWELQQARQQLEALYAQQGEVQIPQAALVVGGLAIVGGLAYFLLAK